MENLISVIVPIYKVESYLQRCLNSIINQTYKNLEIILVDDGSPDNCPQICDEYAKKDSRIKVIHKENGGVSSARNCGLDKCGGEYVMFIDGDDYIERNMMMEMIEKMIKYDVDLVECTINGIVNGKTFENKGGEDFIIDVKNEKNFYKVFKDKKFDMHSVCNKLYKKSKIIEKFNELFVYGEDGIFNFNYYQNISNIYMHNKPLYNYVIHNESFINTTKLKNFDLRVILFNEQEKFAKKINNKKLQSYFCSVMIKNFINSLYFYKLEYGNTKCKAYFKEMLASDNMIKYLKNCKEKDFASIICKSLLKIKSYNFSIFLAKINEKRKQR